jgi:hypothetical protein
MAVAVDEAIGGLDVAVNDTLGVGGGEGVGNLAGEDEKHVDFDRLSGDAALEGQAFEELHGDEGVIAVLADFVDGADVGMVERGSGVSPAAKTFECVGVSGDVARKKFEGDETVEFGVAL